LNASALDVGDVHLMLGVGESLSQWRNVGSRILATSFGGARVGLFSFRCRFLSLSFRCRFLSLFFWCRFLSLGSPAHSVILELGNEFLLRCHNCEGLWDKNLNAYCSDCQVAGSFSL
jgi:hypothetical protein